MGSALTTKHIDILAMLSKFLSSDEGPNALSLAQLSLRVTVTYMVRLEKAFGIEVLDQ